MLDEKILEEAFKKSDSLKDWAKQFKQKRYLFEKIKKTSPDFFVGIRGLRGIGKTVLLLQLANEFESSAYFSADASYLAPHSLSEIVNGLAKKGAKTVFIDEIHYRPDWAIQIKNIYDEHSCRVFFSGSNSLGIRNTGADLSRRAIIHELKTVSYREYLNIRKKFNIPPHDLKQILENGSKLSFEYRKASTFIEEYLQFGGVMYAGEGFKDALDNSIQKIILNDLSALRNVNVKYESDAYRLLYFMANAGPFEASYSTLSSKLGMTKTFLIRMVHDLESTGIIKTVFPCKTNKKDVKKEPKVFFSPPFRTFFAEKPNLGALREDFFVNHTNPTCYVKSERGEKTADFSVNGKIIEVGGATKTFKQKPDFIAADTPLWEKQKIPLYLFGFLY